MMRILTPRQLIAAIEKIGGELITQKVCSGYEDYEDTTVTKINVVSDTGIQVLDESWCHSSDGRLVSHQVFVDKQFDLSNCSLTEVLQDGFYYIHLAAIARAAENALV